MPPSLADSSAPFDDDPLEILRAAQSGSGADPTEAADDEGSIASAPAHEPASPDAAGVSEESSCESIDEVATIPEPGSGGESEPPRAELPDHPEPQGEATPLQVTLDAVPRIQFVMSANGVKVLRGIRIENMGEEDVGDLEIRVKVTPAFAQDVTLRLDSLGTGRARTLEPAFELDGGFLDRITERAEGSIQVEVLEGDRILGRSMEQVSVLTRSEWPGDQVFPELLAAFVLPNEPDIKALLREAGGVLQEWTGSPTIDGYQKMTAESALHQIAAIYEALARMDIQYVSPPASFESQGQRVRLPGEIAAHGQAACLDLTLFVAAALEAAGLHPVIVLVEGHAFCGAFLSERSWSDSVTDDVARLRNDIKMDDLVVFETTAAVAGSARGFDDARRLAQERLEDDRTFRLAVDVCRARRGGIRPMSTLVAERAAGTPGETTPDSPDARTGSAPDTSGLRRGSEPRTTDPQVAESEEAEQGPARIEKWKRMLLDMTLRNRLLNVPAKNKIVRFHVPDVARLEDELAEGQDYSISPRPEEVLGEGEVDEHGERLKRTPEELEDLLVEGFESGLLYSKMEGEALDKRLTALRRESKSAEEEGGSSNLFMAIGLLRFFETEKSEKERLAPIILVPVQLEQRTAREGVKLTARPDEARINVTLLQYLDSEHEIRIEGVDPPPEDGSGLDVPEVFHRFREEIRVKRGWEVLEDALLWMFSFAKILIWRDLDEYADKLVESKVVEHLVNNHRERYVDGHDFRPPEKLDQVAKAKDTFVPMSADSSQLAAIVAAADGKSFVLVGPPGTGKSQTITNLIAHCLATGKTVLFVSEKMAALEVVHRRLTEVGLEDRCLELHSGKTNKKDVLARIDASMRAKDVRGSNSRDEIAKDLEKERDRLNGYVRATHRERPSGETVFQVLSRLIGLGQGEIVDLGWERITETSAEALDRARRTASDAQAAAVDAQVNPAHPLRDIGHETFSPLWEEEARASLEQARAALGTFQATEDSVRSGLLDGLGMAHGARQPMQQTIELLLAAPKLGRDALSATEWTRRSESARELMGLIEGVRTERARFEQRYGLVATDIDAQGLLHELGQAEDSFFLLRFFARRTWLKRFRAVTSPVQEISLVDARADLERMISFQQKEAELRESRDDLEPLFGERWRGEHSDLEELEASLQWIESLRAVADTIGQILECAPAELLSRWAGLLETTGRVPSTLAAAMERYGTEHEAAWAASRDVIGKLSPQDPTPWDVLELDALIPLIDRWLEGWNRDAVRNWCRWQAVRAPAVHAKLEALIHGVETGAVAPRDMAQVLERSYAEVWYKHTISGDEALRDFQSHSHEQAIARFRDLDNRLLAATHQAVRARIAEKQRCKESMVAGVQGSFLRREIQKKSRHRPIRTLFKKAGDLIRELRPCVLMSPLSVAQYLDPSLPRFDVVVFDEASQMPTWDAIGAIARGNQVIVVGDPKQLPPTNFFGKTVSDEEEFDDEGDNVQELESVLDECIASGVDRHLLSWHYRSRHESLIAFSNRKYYEGKLVTFPAASNDGLGVRLNPVPDGVYDFGKSRTNQREAEEVVAEIVRRLKDPVLSRWTIGVVALSQAQQERVEDLLDKARRDHPEIEPFFDRERYEPVFVKNLENVQGDERDVILFTICYGPDLTGRVRMNFGPLNKEGGWRRLNVAITRARREVIVYSTLRADQIDLNRSKAEGVRDLRSFLEFAERGAEAFVTELETDLTAEFDSPFEQEVCRALEERGHVVHRQVGCSGFRIDLAIVDPDYPGRYLIGIECDGASYHSGPSARDRDKLRQEVLEGLGWTLHRIWSTDWWENAEREVEEAVAAIDRALSRRTARLAAEAARTGIGAGHPEEPSESGNEETTRVPRPEAESKPYASSGSTGSGATTLDRSPAPTPSQTVRDGQAGFEYADTSPEVTSRDLTEYPENTAERVEWVLAALRRGEERYKGRLEFYRAHSGKADGWQEDFYEPSANAAVGRTLRAVVRQEGPILSSLAAYRVGVLWGFSHVKTKGTKRVLGSCGRARIHKHTEDGELVLWPDKDSRSASLVPRVGRDEESQRSIDEIPLVELAALLGFWSQEGGPMSERDLFEHAIRSVGLRKLGKKIRARLERALQVARRSGELEVQDGIVRKV